MQLQTVTEAERKREPIPGYAWERLQDGVTDDGTNGMTAAQQRVVARAEALEVPPHLTLGLTLEGIRRAAAGMDCGYDLADAAQLTVEGDRLSWCERLQQQTADAVEVGVATVYVIWHRGTPISKLLSALSNLIECTPCTHRTCFWLRETSTRIHTPEAEALDLAQAVPKVIGAIGHSVLVLEKSHLYAQSAPLRCAYCVAELAFTNHTRCGFWIAMTDDEEDVLHLKLLHLLDLFAGTLAGPPAQICDSRRTACRRGVKHEEASDELPANEATALKSPLGMSLGWLQANVLVATVLTKALIAEARAALRRLPEAVRPTSKIAQDLAVLLQRCGLVDEATEMLQDAVRASLAAFGAADAQTLERQMRLALCYRSQGRFEETATLLQACFATSRSSLGDLVPETIMALEQLEGLGMLLAFSGKRDLLAAAECFLPPLDFHREHLGPLHPRFLSSAFHVGCLLASTGRGDEARQLLVEAKEGSEKALGADHAEAKRMAEALAAFDDHRAASKTIGQRMLQCREERRRLGMM